MGEEPGDRVPKVLYIVGQDRSGSTILGALLGEMDGLFHAGELRNLWISGFVKGRLCGCGTAMRECPFWTAVADEALAGAEPTDVIRWQRHVLRLRNLGRLTRGRAGSPPMEPVEAYAEVMSRLYRAVAARSGARVVVDSSKSPTQAALVAALPGIEASFIHMVRDPRATAYSWGRRKHDPGRGGAMWGGRPASSARAWVVSNLAAERVRRRALPERAMVLRYEDFVARPRVALEAAARLAGESAAGLPLVGHHQARLGPGHTAGGNPVRFRRGPIELREDDEWRTRQRTVDRLLVTAITLPFLHRYGYPIRPAGAR